MYHLKVAKYIVTCSTIRFFAMPSTDLEIWLWNEIRYGNERALYQLYMSSYDYLLRYGLHIAGDRTKAMDGINEVFIEIWIKRDRLQDVKEIRGYLFVIYKRKLLQMIHHKHPVYNLPGDEFLPALQNDSSYEDMLVAMQSEEESKARMRHALMKLTSRQKELIQMRFYESMSMEAISDKLHISLRTIYNTLHAAIGILRKEMGSRQ